MLSFKMPEIIPLFRDGELSQAAYYGAQPNLFRQTFLLFLYLSNLRMPLFDAYEFN